VDTNFFHFASRPILNEFIFIHVSTLASQKNPEAILRAFKKFNDWQPNSKLLMVGNIDETFAIYASSIGIEKSNISFAGIVSYKEVALLMQQSHVFILFSNYENMPCAMLEALCCGIPVIASRVGGIAEIICEQNGILVTAGNEELLYKAMQNIYRQYAEYNGREISKKATSMFSYNTIGKEISDEYGKIIKATYKQLP